jgi:hypothetical protein
MDANNAERMPGDAEADAAIRAMVDQYGRRLERGQEVSYRPDSLCPAGHESRR